MRGFSRRHTLLVFLATLTLLLIADLLFLHAGVLPAMQRILVAAYQGVAHPWISLAFQRIATDAYRIPLWVYEEKLLYLYEAMKIPALVLVGGATAFAWLSTRPPEAKAAIRNWSQRVAFVVSWCLSLALLAYARLGRYSRFMADDYCSAADVSDMGFIGANIHSYLTFSDRFSATFLDALASVLGPHLASFSTLAVMSAWLAAWMFALLQFPLADRRLTRVSLAAMLSAALLFSALQLAFHLEQSLYWGQGMRSVLPPLIFSAICVGMLRSGLAHPRPSGHPWLWSLAAGAIAFVSAGFSETYSAMQVTAWAMVALAALASRRLPMGGNLLRRAAPFLLGSVGGLAFMAAAPANHVRLGASFQNPSLTTIMGIALSSTVDFLKWALLSWQRGLTLIALLALCALLWRGSFERPIRFIDSAKTKKRVLALVPGVTLVLLVASFAPAAYALGGAPPGRTQIIPGFVLVSSTAFLGAVLGQLERRATHASRDPAPSTLRPIPALVLVLFLVTTSEASFARLRQLPAFAQYATLWDANDALIRVAATRGEDHIVVERITQNWAGMPDRELGGDPSAWINACASRYYGIEIAAE